MSNKITCTCGHSWNKSSSSKKDMKICHICGKDNTMKNGGWLDAYDEEMQLGGSVYPANYVPQAENGLEASTDGFTDQGFNYNGAWGGTMEDGGDISQAQNGLWSTNKRAYVDSALNANKNLDWVKRLYDANPKAVMVPGEKYSSTHQIGDNDQGYVFPRIANMNGQLVDLGDSAEDYARETNTGIQFPKEQGTWFARSTGDNSGYKMGTGVLKGKPVMQKYKSIDKKEMGGSLPGSVGFSYARTKGIPSEGPYAKKTLASAQDGLSVDEQMAEASTNMWGYPTEPNFVEAYKKPTKKTTSKKTSTKSKSVKEETDEPDSVEEKKPSIDFRANRERPQMDALRPQTPMMLSRYNPYTGYIREGDSDPNKWNDDRSIFSDARAKERGEKLWDGTKKVTALTQFIPGPVGTTSKVLNTGMGLTDAYYSNREKDPINTLINIAGAMPSGNKYISGIQALSDLTDNFGFEKKPEKKQNGGEMSFYQNGLDWTPRNISRDGSEIPKAQMGTMVTPLDFSKPLGTLEGVSEVMSAPARTATYLLTGKYQDPSQALGIKNPWGALAADAVLDPMNLIGAGVATKAAKSAGKQLIKPLQKFQKNINYSKYIDPERILVGDEIKPAFGFARGNQTFVNENLPKRVRDFVQKHEDYHIYDHAEYPNASNSFLRREIPANFFPAIKDPIGLLSTVKHSLTPERLNFYKNRLLNNRGANSNISKSIKKEEGGEITKDDNGYWNPENWGKPVEIGSNNITMKGLQEMGYDNPLLGISDTGDVQMMYPGEDYKFDGESVTEYPIAQLGKTVPPLNVSDPNDPRLKAYNDSLFLFNKNAELLKGMNDRKYKLQQKEKSNLNSRLIGLAKTADKKLPLNHVTKNMNLKNEGDGMYSLDDYASGIIDKTLPRQYFKPGIMPQGFDVYTQNLLGLGLGDKRVAFDYSNVKPKQKVILNPPTNTPKKTEPKPKPQPVKKKPTPQPKPVQEQPIKKTEPPKPVEVKQNVYEGSPVYSNMLGDGARSALVGFVNPQGDTTYIKPEDYQRYGVPAYGKEYIESKTKKKKNGGWLEKYN